MRRLVAPLLAVIVLVAAAAAVLSYVAAEDPQDSIVLADIEGTVTVTGSDGHSEIGTRGEELDVLDRVQTTDGGAVLAIGDDTRIRIKPKSTIEVTGHDEHTVSFELDGGAIEATVRPGTSGVRVGSRGRQVLATDATFGMGVDDQGTLVVEVNEGQALTSGMDGVTSLGSGDRATVAPGGGTVVQPIPSELLLAVQWPEVTRQKEPTTQVAGQTVPLARVTVEGGARVVTTTADKEGRFSVDVPLSDDRVNKFTVTATDPLGNVAAVDGGSVEFDNSGPGLMRGGATYGTGNP